MADVEALSGIKLPVNPTVPLEAAPMQYVDHRVQGNLSDEFIYGDLFSTMRRMDGAILSGSPFVNQIIRLIAGSASDAFTATKLRIYCCIAAAGTGTFNAAVFTGPDSAALTRRATITQATSLSVGLIEFPLSTGVVINAEDHVAIAILSQSFTMHPMIVRQSGAPPSALVNANLTKRLSADSSSAQTSIPASINMGSGFSGNGVMAWAALAA